MRFTFENRYYQTHEIQKQFAIKEKTWKVWLYGDTVKIKGKSVKKAKQDLLEMGLRKVPGSNYYVVDPNRFQDWFLTLIGEPDEE
mgnify:FL=1|jgi:hypothetical protein|tara:strand:+ start:3687 stop:3941 length:255 start_codon:yes stop_codon:yes gene_type:complete